MSGDTADPEVLDMVREQLQRRFPPSTAALYGRAVRIDPSIRELSLRQFNAKYPLQVKRQLKRKKEQETAGASGDASQKESVDRRAIEEVLVRFAREVVAAQGTAAVIDALAGVDAYVEEIVTATART